MIEGGADVVDTLIPVLGVDGTETVFDSLVIGFPIAMMKEQSHDIIA